MRARVKQDDRGVNGGEGRTVAWPGGEAAMAPQARRSEEDELVLWRRRARLSGVVIMVFKAVRRGEATGHRSAA